MKILIITHYFPPLNSIASLRPYSWAKYWAMMGHEITVLTTEKRIDKNALRLDCSMFQVVEIKESLKWKIANMVTIKDTSHGVNRDPQYRFRFNLLEGLKNFFDNKGIVSWDARMPNLFDFWFKDALPRVVHEEWDVVVSTFAPYVTHLIAYRLQKESKTKCWIVDYRDLWTQSHIFKGLFPFTMIEEYFERKVNLNADIITTVSEPLAQNLRRKYGLSNVCVIENGFDLEDSVLLDRTPYWSDNMIKLVYTGSLYKNLRDPSPLFDAIRAIRDSRDRELLDRLEVIFLGQKSDYLFKLINQYAVDRWVKYLGYLSREDALRMQRDAHALLFLEVEAPVVDGILTGKLFEYLASGTEIWGIGLSGSSLPGRLILESGHGKIFGKAVKRIETELLNLLRSGQKKIIRKNNELLAKYSRRVLAEKMILMAEHVIKGSK